jgi:hypothetical protein
MNTPTIDPCRADPAIQSLGTYPCAVPFQKEGPNPRCGLCGKIFPTTAETDEPKPDAVASD